MLKVAGLSTSGLKDLLVARLINYIDVCPSDEFIAQVTSMMQTTMSRCSLRPGDTQAFSLNGMPLCIVLYCHYWSLIHVLLQQVRPHRKSVLELSQTQMIWTCNRCCECNKMLTPSESLLCMRRISTSHHMQASALDTIDLLARPRILKLVAMQVRIVEIFVETLVSLVGQTYKLVWDMWLYHCVSSL